MINAAAPQSIELEQYVRGYAEAQSGMVDTVDPQSRPRQAAVAMIARMARRTGTALAGVYRLNISPGYFELERRSGEVMHLTPGVTWESDSFWAVSAHSYPRN
jgi:hypothetical protein